MRFKAHRILILHGKLSWTQIEWKLTIPGHGQSAEIIKPKTRYVREAFSTLPEDVEFEFEYLSGILPAYPDAEDTQDQRVWGYGEPEKDKIKGLDKSIKHILDALDQRGPFSGMIGFSSGAAMTAIVTSMLEKRKTLCDIPWEVNEMPLINFRGHNLIVFIKTRHPQLKFAICLSGFKLKNQCYEAFYSPRILTPMFHAFGQLDATITPAQTEMLALDCSYPWFYQFFGGHYVPQSKEYMSFRRSLEGFLRDVLGLGSKLRETWTDVDVFDAGTICEGQFSRL